MRRLVTRYEKELGEMPSSQRGAPAYINLSNAGAEHPSGLSTQSDPMARIAVRFNKDFFDPQLPGSAPQLIILETDLPWTDAEYEKVKSSTGRVAVENNALFNELINKLDW